MVGGGFKDWARLSRGRNSISIRNPVEIKSSVKERRQSRVAKETIPHCFCRRGGPKIQRRLVTSPPRRPSCMCNRGLLFFFFFLPTKDDDYIIKIPLVRDILIGSHLFNRCAIFQTIFIYDLEFCSVATSKRVRNCLNVQNWDFYFLNFIYPQVSKIYFIWNSLFIKVNLWDWSPQ